MFVFNFLNMACGKLLDFIFFNASVILFIALSLRIVLGSLSLLDREKFKLYLNMYFDVSPNFNLNEHGPPFAS